MPSPNISLSIPLPKGVSAPASVVVSHDAQGVSIRVQWRADVPPSTEAVEAAAWQETQRWLDERFSAWAREK